MSDDFGDRMKAYEMASSYQFGTGRPICARIDGRGFSKFTKGFLKPFDAKMTMCMQETTKYLVESTNASIGYTQSDEISLVWENAGPSSIPFFAGKTQKMVSILAAAATAAFTREAISNDLLPKPELLERLPMFDSRVWAVPDKVEAANTILWRAQDAKRNGISSACHEVCGHKAMQGVNQAGMLKLMADRGVVYAEEYFDSEKFGTMFKRVTVEGVMTLDTWYSIPASKRPWPPEHVKRNHVEKVGSGYFGDVSDRVEFIFGEKDK